MSNEIGVGVIGAGWMGHVHARAYARLRHHYPNATPIPHIVAVADSVEAQRADFVARHGEMAQYADWRELIADPKVQAISVTAPNSLHREIGVAVAEAGKHLWIEKPVGLTLADAQAVADAVRASGVQSTVGFNYRNFPAVIRAREAIKNGEIGRITHARIYLFTDYAGHPGGPISWRYALAQGGHGVLGDLASHGIDMLRFVVGDLDSLVARTATFIDQRPIAQAGVSHYNFIEITPETPMGEVENEDYVCALIETQGGVLATFESSRVAVGDENTYGFEVHGTKGVAAWDFRRSDEFTLASGDNYQHTSVTRHLAAPGDGDYAAFQPGAGIAMGYDDSKVVEAAGFIESIRTGTPHGATIADAVASAAALDAIVASADSRAWVTVAR